MQPIAVRRATIGDTDAIVRLWREMMDLHQEIEPAIWAMRTDAEEAFRMYLAQCLQDPDHMIAMAVRAEEPLGFIHAAKVQRPPVLEPPVEGIIHGCCVTRNARRQGIGCMLVAEATKWFREQSLTIARASWAINNPLSGPFWVAQGFRPYQVSGVCAVAVEADANSDQATRLL